MNGSTMNENSTSTLPPNWPRRISIIGAAGLVGSSVAAQLVTRGLGQEIYLQDRRENVLEAHRIDLADAQAILGLDAPLLISGPPPEGSVDLVIVAASLPERPDGDRRDFLSGNADLLDSLAEGLLREAGEDGLILLLTNPVDILADWLCRRHGLDPERLIGYALNDSARLRLAVAREFGVPTSSVEAIVLGEHGKGQVPVFSTIRLDGKPVSWPEGAIDSIRANIDGWFERWSQLGTGRSSGWATGFGVMHLVRSLAAGQTVVTTAATTEIDSLPDTFMTLPAQFINGRIQVALPKVSDEEIQILKTSAESILEASSNIP